MFRPVLLIFLVSGAMPSSADACSCGVPEFRFPADGATDVPRDVEVVIAGWELGEPMLVDEDGSEVAVQRRVERGDLGDDWTLLSPLEPLASHRIYQIVTARDTSAFRTGFGLAPQAQPSDVEALWLTERTLGADCVSTCNPTPEVRFAALQWTTGSAVAYHELVLVTPDETWRRLIPPDFSGTLSTSLCGGGLPEVAAGQPLCATLVSVGENGERAPAGASACAEAIECSSECGDVPSRCETPFTPGARASEAGPSGCSIAGPGPPGGGLFLLLLVRLRARSADRRAL